MPIRKADNENAVRVGWARDEDNEVIIDGYNALIQITTDDGTSGFEIQNSIGATSFLIDSDGDGYVAKRFGIGTENPEVALEVIGKTRTDELQVAIGGQSGYVLTSDGSGNATWQPPEAASGLFLDGYVTDERFQDYRRTQEEINYHIIVALDGYETEASAQENYNAFSEAIQTIRKDLEDGYADISGSSADGYIAFFTGTTSIAGDNDLYFDRVSNQLQVSNFKLTTNPVDGYVLTSDSLGNATWQPNTALDRVTALNGSDGYIAFFVDGNIIAGDNDLYFDRVSNQLQVSDFKLTTAPTEGYVLTSDNSGNASWQPNAALGGVTASDGADGYIAFFIGPNIISGDNDLYFDRVSNQLQVSDFKLTTNPVDGYVLTTDNSGNASWKENPGNPARHRELDQLVHNVAETSYETYTYMGSDITNITVWTSTEMVTKIREEQFTYTGSRITTVVIIQYDHLGIATETLTENLTYSGNDIVNIIRTLS